MDHINYLCASVAADVAAEKFIRDCILRQPINGHSFTHSLTCSLSICLHTWVHLGFVATYVCVYVYMFVSISPEKNKTKYALTLHKCKQFVFLFAFIKSLRFLLQVLRAASPALLRVIALGAFFIYCTVSGFCHDFYFNVTIIILLRNIYSLLAGFFFHFFTSIINTQLQQITFFFCCVKASKHCVCVYFLWTI